MRWCRSPHVSSGDISRRSLSSAEGSLSQVAADDVVNVESAAASKSYELQQLLRTGNCPNRARADALIQEIVALKAPFDVATLGGGLWQAVYTKGAVPKWERNARFFSFLRNIAGQDYDIGTSRVTNYGEILGRSAYVTAEGRFKETDASMQHCPKDYDVFVERGALHLGPLRIPLPIKGRGYLRCLYADPHLRIFVSPEDSPGKWEDQGLVVVQLPMTALRPSWRAPYSRARS